MNLIIPEKSIVSDNEWFTIPDWRKQDHQKIFEILQDMFNKLSKLFGITYEINLINNLESKKIYLSEYANYLNTIEINIQVPGSEKINTIKLVYPQLVQNNYFILNGNMYVPLLFLERNLIDRINDIDENGKNIGKIILNLMSSFNLTFDFINDKILFRGKKLIDPTMFFNIMFEGDKEYLEYLVSNNIIKKIKKPTNDEINLIIKALDMTSLNTKKNDRQITLPEFFDDYLLLDYFKEIFKLSYGVDNIKDILKTIIKYYICNINIDMADLKNRRVVINEYLIFPIFEYYIRFLKNIVNNEVEAKDNDKKVFIPTMNAGVLMTSGFSGLMHSGQFYNISLPFTTPLLYKVSQKIYIVGEKVPKSWTSNHKSSYGRICPISVSAQDMGENLVFTSSVRLNKYGLIEGTGAILEDKIREEKEDGSHTN